MRLTWPGESLQNMRVQVQGGDGRRERLLHKPTRWPALASTPAGKRKHSVEDTCACALLRARGSYV
eukprot:4871454-Pleurochrysis_carterae.AAC.1